jgi:hypothetical protein
MHGRDVAAGFPEAGLDLQELETPGVDLGRDQLRTREVMTRQPQLVGQEAMATQALGLELQFQFRDVVARLAPEPGDAVIDQPEAAAQVSGHKAMIGDRLAAPAAAPS